MVHWLCILHCMKKMTVTIDMHSFFYDMMKKVSPIDAIESIEILDFLKIDIEKYYKILLLKISMKQNHSIEELEECKNIEIISTIEKDDRTITCLMKGKMPLHYLSKLGNITKQFNANVIWDVPSRMNGREIVISALGDEKDINKIAKACKLIGTIKKISFNKNFIYGIDILKCLTSKQKRVLIKALQEGYYEYPRKINTNILSEQVSLSKSTTVEHLRKAENRLIATILSGYQ